MNLFASSLIGNNSDLVPCSRSSQCSNQKFYKLHINCSGETVTSNGHPTYDGDKCPGGPSDFYQSPSNWAFSSTGHFMDNEKIVTYTVQNLSRLSMPNPELYMNARLSPLSLTYYAFCMENGNCTVNLHFAEIMFTENKTYSSLGRRIFDIYIQGELIWKDFNIVKEADGVGKERIKNCTAVVTNNTLEIRLYWAGKGTTAIPMRSVYGPLISAISVESDFTTPSESLSLGAKFGITTVGAFVIFLVLGILWWKCYLQKSKMEQDLKGLNLQTGTFTLRQIKAATNNFDAANKIGEGGFGSVYKWIYGT